MAEPQPQSITVTLPLHTDKHLSSERLNTDCAASLPRGYIVQPRSITYTATPAHPNDPAKVVAWLHVHYVAVPAVAGWSL